MRKNIIFIYLFRLKILQCNRMSKDKSFDNAKLLFTKDDYSEMAFFMAPSGSIRQEVIFTFHNDQILELSNAKHFLESNFSLG